MRKLLMVILLVLFPVVAHAQQAQMPSMQSASSIDSEKAIAIVVGAAIGAVAGAFVLPVALTAVASVAAAIAHYSTPILGGAGAAAGAWFGYNM